MVRTPLAAEQHRRLGPLRVADARAAILASVLRLAWSSFRPNQLRPPQRLHVAAMRARDVVAPVSRQRHQRLDQRCAAHRWRRGQQELAPSKAARSALDQTKRRTLATSRRRPAVDLVSEDVARRHTRQRCRAVRADHPQKAAGELLDQLLVPAVPRLRVARQRSKLRRRPQQRREALLRVKLSHLKRRLHHQQRRGLVVDNVAHPVQSGLCLAQLRTPLQHHALARVGR
jgi:hypothetical protein